MGAGKTLLSHLGACRLPLTWAGGGVWQSTQLQEHVDGSMEIQRMAATGMLQETDLQNQSNKTEYGLSFWQMWPRVGGKRLGGDQEG